MNIKFFVFSVNASEFPKTHENEPKHDKRNLREVWPWQLIRKTSGKIGIKLCKLTFAVCKYQSY